MQVGKILELLLGPHKDGSSGLLRDPGASESDILGLIQDALEDLSSRVLLPSLNTSAVVSTVPGVGSAAAPDNFQRNLYKAQGPDGERLQVFHDLKDLEALFPSGLALDSPVAAVAIGGGAVHYRPAPSEAKDLTIWYHKAPGAERTGVEGLVAPEMYTDEITCVPDRFLRETVVNYILANRYEHVEDQLDGGRVNAGYFREKYEGAVRAVRAWVNRDHPQPAVQLQVMGRRF